MAWITKPPKKKRAPIINNKYAEYYNTKQWKSLRNSYIKQHPLCERCLSLGKVTPAEHVHHIIPFMKGEDKYEKYKLLLDYRNLMSLCVQCHQYIHHN